MGLLAIGAGACIESRSPQDGDGSGSCAPELAQTLTVGLPGDAPLELRVESCRRDADACPLLCSFVVERELEIYVARCEVTLSTTTLTVAYAQTQGSCLW